MSKPTAKDRIKLWKEVLAELHGYYLKFQTGESVCICGALTAAVNKSSKFRDMFNTPYFHNLKKEYPEFYKYKPKTMYRGRAGNMTYYWWAPRNNRKSYDRRVQTVRDIIKDLENSLA